MKYFRGVSVGAVVLTATLAGILLFSGCSRDDEQTQERARTESVDIDEETAAAASTRAVPQEGYGDESDPLPRVLLSELTYEWRTSPEKGLMVMLEFTNPADTYERARGYVFLIAEYEAYGGSIAERGVYPWNTKMENGLPQDYTEGAHLLYRDEQAVRAFIPYGRSDGYCNRLKLYVYHEDGRLITNRTYDLDITGTPGETGSVKPGFDL
ncbi:MAG: hypothetical protein JXB46_04670 [Candidatus Eisenbacteria bacterium]|nr:hypothetical protein [Candidatus Eisenbacteria bacterium]